MVASASSDLRALLVGLAQLVGNNWAVNSVLIHQVRVHPLVLERLFTTAKLKASPLQR